jgi:hypothetical protein
MTGQHFKEYVETLCKTYNIPKTLIARHIGISKVWLNKYELHGVPIAVKPMVMKRLRDFYLARLQVS